MISVGRYTFTSWLRRGVGNRISQPDRLGVGGSGTPERATVPVDVVLNGTAISKSFGLIGPGDIIGVNPQMVVRTEPRNSIGNFEPNYLPFVEFYDEDFPWRYTPARPTGEKLSPWLALLVLEAPENNGPGEFEISDRREPLPTLRVTAPAALPPPTQSWAFAHVSINEGHATPTDFETFLLSLREPGAFNADKIISRLASPRRLAVDTAYRAFVVPAFETGRLAGLGEDPSGVDSQAPSWTSGNPVELPYYFEWQFRTGESEDFESLVKRLEPRPVDPRVGVRDMDAGHPGFGVAAGADIGAIPPPAPTDPPPPQTVLGLEGALRAPQSRSRPATVDPTKPFLAELARVLNMADDRLASSPGPVDPVVTPPVYGGRHARRTRVDFATPGWLTTLNRDPRLRVSAGIGTRVVQTHQEDYVARAWAQVNRILAMNRRIRAGRFAMETATTMQASFFTKITAANLLSVASPVMKKVRGSSVTLHRLVADSRVTGAPLDAATRRLLRPRGVVARRLRQGDPTFTFDRLVEEINDGKVTAAPPKNLPAGLPSDDDVARRVGAGGAGIWSAFLRRLLWWLALLLLILAVLLLLVRLWLRALASALLAGVALTLSRALPRPRDVATGILNPGRLQRILADVPPQTGFALVETDPPPRPGETGVTRRSVHVGIMPSGIMSVVGTSSHSQGRGADSLEAETFRRAAGALGGRLGIKPETPARLAVDLDDAARKLAAAITPQRAWPRLLAHELVLNFALDWLKDPEHLVPALAYPDFDDAMYEKVRDLSAELFLPNIQLIPPDTITLLKANPAFIEAYMVGLNHEFGRELLWREYPTDERGSYFRQFWSVRGLVTPQPDATVSAEQIKAMYRDISPLDTWMTASTLGTHRPPERPSTGDLVLTIRGELLKKYHTIVYAQKAHMARNRAGTLDPSLKPVIKAVATATEMATEIRFPLFTADVDPDLRFFGFDLTIQSAKGAERPQTDTDDWGWFFVLQEVPGEPRFGLDLAFDPDDDAATPITWNDLSWENLPPGVFLDPATPPVPRFFNLLAPDLKAKWGRHAADMASILFQRPVMIAVHAREMLESLSA